MYVGFKLFQTAVLFAVYGSTLIAKTISVNEPFSANHFIHPQSAKVLSPLPTEPSHTIVEWWKSRTRRV